VRDDIVVRSLGRDAPVRRVYAAVHDGGYRSPATAAMLDVLREVAERLSARRPELELVG
jgi:DNA-binding transcriptional LysR family regulator